MPHKNTSRHPIADALREAGYIKLPNLWVLPEDMPKIHEITARRREAVNTIKYRVRLRLENSVATDADPLRDRNAAWDAMEQQLRTPESRD